MASSPSLRRSCLAAVRTRRESPDPRRIYVRVRRACMVEGMSVREASRVFGLHRDTVRKMLAYSAPPGYRRQDPPRRPRLEPFTGVIDAILEADRQVSQEVAPHGQADL